MKRLGQIEKEDEEETDRQEMRTSSCEMKSGGVEFVSSSTPFYRRFEGDMIVRPDLKASRVKKLNISCTKGSVYGPTGKRVQQDHVKILKNTHSPCEEMARTHVAQCSSATIAGPM